MLKSTTCVFIGHSECYGVDKQALEKAILRQISLGVTDFLCGGMGGFDWLCARRVRQLKTEHPHIQCLLVIPYRTAELKEFAPYYDEIIYPDYKSTHAKGLILERNRYMIDCAGYAVCYVIHSWGGAAKSFQYAQKQGLAMTNLNG